MLSTSLIAAHAPVIAAAVITALGVSLAIVLTQRHHGHLTTDNVIGVQKFHVNPTPRVGGVGIYLGLLLAGLLVKDPDARKILMTLLLAGIPALAFGLLEDITKRVGVLTRLLATMASGLLAWWISGVALNSLDIPLLDDALTLLPVAVLFTAFAVGGVANTVNIIDGFHGLASGTVLIALLALAAIAGRAGDAPLALVCALLAAAVAGFWLVNFPWGKLFLGDGGAYFAGFALAWLALLLPMRNPDVSPWAGLMVCAYPVIEVIYSIMRRRQLRLSPGAPDSLHLHSLVKTQVIRKKLLHWSRRQRNAAVAPLMWCFAALPAAMALAWYNYPTHWLALGLLVCVVVYHQLYKRLAAARLRETRIGLRANGRGLTPMPAPTQPAPPAREDMVMEEGRGQFRHDRLGDSTL
jgi:UDP-N-acetylmuramyl pentapeptide phosphotransferase/UDP-N-acetylglucosamine-1-phosphate transferase